MYIDIAFVIVGLVLLVWSADKFIEGSVSVAKNFNISPLVIGMVIVGFGTSLPEMIVSIISSIEGQGGLALGNIIGSNIANIGLILGVTTLIVPIAIKSEVIKKELPILLVITVIFSLMFMDKKYVLYEGLVILALFISVIVWTYKEKTKTGDELAEEVNEELEEANLSIGKGFFWLLTGMITLILSSRALVYGAVNIATALGVSELVIGLTMIALGTSLPELASSLMAIKKNEHDLALGNVLGSNLFNILLVGGIVGVLDDIEVDSIVVFRDIPVMLFLTVSILFFAYLDRKNPKLRKWQGGIFLAIYIFYIASIYVNSLTNEN